MLIVHGKLKKLCEAIEFIKLWDLDTADSTPEPFISGNTFTFTVMDTGEDLTLVNMNSKKKHTTFIRKDELE